MPPQAQKTTTTDPYADMPDPTAQADPYADMPDPTIPDFSAPKGNKEGTYRMRAPGGEEKPVPHSKVMDAYKAGWMIHPDDRDTFGKNREFEFKQQGKKFNPDLDMPLAYDVVGASPKVGSLPWVKEMAQRARDKTIDLLPAAGGVAGGFAAGGAGVLTGPADIAAAAGGAAAGGAIGEDIRQAAEERAHPYEHRQTPGEAAKGVVEQGALQGANELTGRVAGRVLSPASKYFSTAANESAKAGVRMLPSEAAGKAPSYLEKLAKGHIYTSGTMEKFRAAQNAETQTAVQKIADSISKFNGNSEDLGDLVQQGIKSHTEQFRKIQKVMYDDIRKQVNERTIQVTVPKQIPTGYMLAGNVPEMKNVMVKENRLIDNVMPSTVAIKKFAEEELKKLDKVSAVLDPNLLSQSRAMLEHLTQSPDNITFDGMVNARSDALAKVRELDQAMAGKQAGLAKKIAGLFDEALEDGMQKKMPQLVPAVRAANELTSNEHRMFEQALVKKIVDTKKPEAIATLLRGKTIGNQELRDLFTIIPDEMHPIIQRQLLLDTMRDSTHTTSKVFNERRFADAIGNLGDERGGIIFGNNWGNVKKFTGLLEKINGPTGMGGGSGAALQNIGVIKAILATAGGFAYGTNHPILGTISEGLALGGEFVSFRAMASALTHPATTAALIKAMQVAARVGPYGLTGAVEAGGGVSKTKTKVTDLIKQAQQQKPTESSPAAAPAAASGEQDEDETGPQSQLRPTHVYDESRGMIVPA